MLMLISNDFSWIVRVSKSSTLVKKVYFPWNLHHCNGKINAHDWINDLAKHNERYARDSTLWHGDIHTCLFGDNNIIKNKENIQKNQVHGLLIQMLLHK